MRPAWVVIFLYFPRWMEIGVGSKTMEVVWCSVVVGKKKKKKKNEDVIEQGEQAEATTTVANGSSAVNVVTITWINRCGEEEEEKEGNQS